MKKPTYIIHREEERGEMKLDWLHSRFSFSFADWYEPSRMGYGVLRVINDDIISPNSGFGFHPHTDMEIITIVFSGELTHKDSMGNTGIIKKGDVQRMSAGTGVVHSEYNYSKKSEVRLFQIWILPKKYGIKPDYEQKEINYNADGLTLIVSPNGKNNSVKINQDAWFTIANIQKNKEIIYEKKQTNNITYSIIIEGEINYKEEILKTRDAIGIENEDKNKYIAVKNSKILIIEIPKNTFKPFL
jgi:hypothetical protein